MVQQWGNILSNTPLFHGIETEELGSMLDCIQPMVASYKKNEVIAVAGTPLQGIGIVLTGELTVTKENAAGNRVIMTLLEQGDLFGEMAAFSEVKCWPATVYAQNDSQVFFIAPEKIVGSCSKACVGHRKLIINMLTILTNKALILNEKVEYLALRSIRGKISAFLLDQYNKTKQTTFMLPMNRNELADFLNVTRPSLSREMSKMREEGLIDFHRASFRILDQKRLQESIA